MNKYRFRINPSEEQHKRLLWTLKQCCYVYNKLLEKLQREKLITTITSRDITTLKRRYKILYDVPSTILLNLNNRIYNEWKDANQQIKRMRQLKDHDFKTLVFYRQGYKFIQNHTGGKVWLHISKIGDIPVDVNKDISGVIKKIMITCSSSSNWFVDVVTEPVFCLTKNTKD